MRQGPEGDAGGVPGGVCESMCVFVSVVCMYAGGLCGVCLCVYLHGWCVCIRDMYRMYVFVVCVCMVCAVYVCL